MLVMIIGIKLLPRPLPYAGVRGISLSPWDYDRISCVLSCIPLLRYLPVFAMYMAEAARAPYKYSRPSGETKSTRIDLLTFSGPWALNPSHPLCLLLHNC